MTHQKLKQYLLKVMETNPDAIATYEINGEVYPIHEVFGLDREDVDYYELYSDIGFEGQESDNTALTVEDIFNTIYSFPIERSGQQRTNDTRIDIIVGNEDGNDIHTGEIESRNLIFTDTNGEYIPHKKDVEATAFGIYSDNLSISIEEERGESIQDIIDETISDMRMDFSENSGETLTIKEQETMQMFHYTKEELEKAKKLLEDKYLEKEYKKGIDLFLNGSFNGIPNIEQPYGKLLDLEKIEEIKSKGVELTHQAIVDYNRTISTTNNIYLFSKLFPSFEFKNEYDKNKSQFDFNYTLSDADRVIEVEFNSKTQSFKIFSNELSNNEITHFQNKLQDGLTNLNTFFNSLTTYKGEELKINKPENPRHNPSIKEEWKPVKSDSEEYLYNEENAFGKILSNDLFASPENYTIYTVVNFGDEDIEYEVYFGNTPVAGGINKIEDLDTFVKVNTLINKFEGSKSQPFNTLLNEVAGLKQTKQTIQDFISFASEQNVIITKDDLKVYASIDIVHMPKHGFQNLISNIYPSDKKTTKNNKDS